METEPVKGMSNQPAEVQTVQGTLLNAGQLAKSEYGRVLKIRRAKNALVATEFDTSKGGVIHDNHLFKKAVIIKRFYFDIHGNFDMVEIEKWLLPAVPNKDKNSGDLFKEAIKDSDSNLAYSLTIGKSRNGRFQIESKSESVFTLNEWLKEKKS